MTTDAPYNSDRWANSTVFYMFHRGMIDAMGEWSNIAAHERHTRGPEFNAWYEDLSTRLGEWTQGIDIENLPREDKPVIGAHVAMAGCMLYASAMSSLRHIDEITAVSAAMPRADLSQLSVDLKPLVDMTKEAEQRIMIEDAVLYESEEAYAHAIVDGLEAQGEEVCQHLRNGELVEPEPDLGALLAQALGMSAGEWGDEPPSPSNGHYQA